MSNRERKTFNHNKQRRGLQKNTATQKITHGKEKYWSMDNTKLGIKLDNLPEKGRSLQIKNKYKECTVPGHIIRRTFNF